MLRKCISTVILCLCLASFCYAGYQLYLIYHSYHMAETEYDGLVESYVKIENKEGTSQNAESPSASVEELEYPPLQIDFTALKTVNEDIIGWLYLESCEVNYPIVQGEDNELYLHRTSTKQQNSCGSIFMDYRNRSDFYDYNTFIYGHNMKNGSMFGKLKQLYRESELCDQNPYFYIYLVDGEVLKYRIFSYYITTDQSDSYRFAENDEDYDAYVKTVQSRSSYKTSLDTAEIEEALEEKNVLVTLSTCSGASNGNQRFLVHGVCVADYQ